MRISVFTHTLGWAQGFNVSSYTTIKPKTLGYRNQQVFKGKLRQSQLTLSVLVSASFWYIFHNFFFFFVKINDALQKRFDIFYLEFPNVL